MQFLSGKAIVSYLFLTIGTGCILLPAINAQDDGGGGGSGGSSVVDTFKNKDVILRNLLPDLRALNYANIRDSTANYFGKLLAAWDSLNIPQSMILKGEVVWELVVGWN